MIELVKITNEEIEGVTEQRMWELVVEKINKELDKNKETENKDNCITNWVLPGLEQENWEENPYVLNKKSLLSDGNLRLMAIYIRKEINKIRDILVQNKNDWSKVDEKLLEDLKTIKSWEGKEIALNYQAWGMIGYPLIKELDDLLATQKMNWEEFNKFYRGKHAFSIQEFLDSKYPTAEIKFQEKEIKLDKEQAKNLVGGKLDLNGYLNLEKVVINGDYLRSRLTSLDLTNCPNLKSIQCDKNYLTRLNLGGSEKLTELDCSNNQFTELDLSDCRELKELNCQENKLTKLSLDQLEKLTKLNCKGNNFTELDLCPGLKELNCANNQLTTLDLSQSKLEILDISNNNFPEQDLSFLSHLVDLKKLKLGGNNFTDSLETLREMKNLTYLNINGVNMNGSLEPLQNMIKLRKLDISNTDLDSGLEHLPDSLEHFYCSVDKKPQAKVKLIEQELRKYGKPEKGSDNFAIILKLWKVEREKIYLKRKIIDLESALENQKKQIKLAVEKTDENERTVELRAIIQQTDQSKNH